jgi:hypothetical protein
VDSNFENKSGLVFIMELEELHITKLKQNLNRSLRILVEAVSNVKSKNDSKGG